MFNKKPATPLLVEVTSSEWFSYGDPTSLRHARLHAYLTRMGGINETVPPGTYHFNASRRGFKLYMTLDPAE